MGTIVARKRADKTTAYMAKIILKKDGAVVHRETKTFDRRPAAAAWIARREEELRQPGALERAARSGDTLADAIDRYTEKSLKQIGRTKAQVLAAVKTYPIAGMAAASIQAQDIVNFADELSRTRKPQTVGNYLSHLSSVFAIARPAWGIGLDYQAMKDAQAVLKRLGTVKASDRKERRPTLGELDALLTLYADRERRTLMAPMTHIILFALFSTRRQDEICRIRWDDLDEDGSRILVRDMKNPGEKFGNDVWCDLPPEALAAIRCMPKVRDEIFPYNAGSISASFTRACKLLDIEDMDFHRLRHEGVSRLFEMGKGIPQVAAVSGHRSWSSLKRYAHIRQTGDKYSGWSWLEHLDKPARAGSKPLSKRTKASRGLPVD